MRKIKFRAWQKATKTMFFVKIITMTPEGVFACFLTDEVSSCDVNPDEIDLMQYTGLKDKNGTEEYRKDVVAYSISETQHYKGVIEWNEKCAAFQIHCFWTKELAFGPNSKDGAGNRKVLYEGPSTAIHTMGSAYDVEVIGNSLQHPGLLSSGKKESP